MVMLIIEVRLKQVYEDYYAQFLKYDYLVLKYHKLIMDKRLLIKNLKKIEKHTKIKNKNLKNEKKELDNMKQQIKNAYEWRTYFNKKMLKILNEIQKNNINHYIY